MQETGPFYDLWLVITNEINREKNRHERGRKRCSRKKAIRKMRKTKRARRM